MQCSVCDGAIIDGDDTTTVDGRTFHSGCVEAGHVEADPAQNSRGVFRRWSGWLGWGQGG